MIGYYIHHHGYGHLARASSVCARMHRPVTALTSLDVVAPHPFSAIVRLSRDDEGTGAREHTAHGALHWAPHHDPGLSARMHEIASWVRDARPEAIVVDVSVEVAMFVRLLGIPLVVVALPGQRTDAAHLMVHRIADHILAAWPKPLCIPAWLRPHEHKTTYTGGISRFEDRSRAAPEPAPFTRGLVLDGSGGDGGTALADCVAAETDIAWTTLGGASGNWRQDPWAEICAADVVVTHAGQGSIADVAAALRPAIVIPAPRPFGEQASTASVLRRHRLAVVAQAGPDTRVWRTLLARSRAGDPLRWKKWQVDGATQRAAAAIETTAQLCRAVGR